MPNWLDLLKLMNQQGNEPDPTPGRYAIPPELLPASNKDSTVLKQSPVTDHAISDDPTAVELPKYPTISEDSQTYPLGLFESGGAAGVSRGESGTWEKPPLPPPPQFVSGGAIGGASRGTTGDWNAPTPPTVATPTLPPPATPPPAQSTSNLDAVQQAAARGELVTPETPPAGGGMVKRAELIRMPTVSQMVTPYTPGELSPDAPRQMQVPSEMVSAQVAPPGGGVVRRAQLVAMPVVSQMVTPYTTPPAPQVRSAIPVVGTTSAAGAPRAQLVQAHPYDLSTYSPEQTKAFLEKIKGLPQDQPIPTSVYESVVPIPKAQLVSMGTPATRAAVAAAAKVGAPAPVLTSPTATPSGILRGLAYGPRSEGATAADQRQTHGPLGQLQQGDIAVSPNLLNQYPLGSRVHVVDRNGKIVFPNRRVADTSWYSAGRPTSNTFELWNGPSLGSGYRLVRA